MFYDYLCKGKSLYLSTQCLLITISFPDMDIVDKLNKEFLTQPFCKNEQLPEELNEYKRIAYNYARIENSIAVLSEPLSYQTRGCLYLYGFYLGALVA